MLPEISELFTWSNAAQLEPTQISLLVSACVFLVGIAIFSTLRSKESLQRRLSPDADFGGLGDVDDPRSLHFTNNRKLGKLLAIAGQSFMGSSKDEVSSIRHQLVQAGFLSPTAVQVYYGVRVVFACVLPLAFILLSGFLPAEVPGLLVFGIAAGMAVVGLILPGVALDWRRTAVRENYQRTFPDMMDLLVVCIESGHSVPAAFDRVGKEMFAACPELGANIHIMCLEMRAGRTLPEALEGLYNRVGIEEVKSLKLLLKQSEELGASIATTLRVYSDEMRDKRLIRAETKAHALPVKLTLPLGMCIFPVTIMVIMVPIVIRITNSLL